MVIVLRVYSQAAGLTHERSEPLMTYLRVSEQIGMVVKKQQCCFVCSADYFYNHFDEP